MPKRYFNWKLAIVLLIGLVVLGVTAFGLRQWQRTNRADQGLILGNKAYDEQKWEEAAQYLGRYIAIEQNDVPVLMKYAEAQLKIRPLRNSNFAQAESAYQNVLRADKNNVKAALQLTELYLLIGKPGETELIASKYLENNDNPDPEVRRMLASALAEQRKFSEASLHLEAIIQEHPDQILAYEMMGQLVKNRPDDTPVSPEMLEQIVKNLLDDVPVSSEMLEQRVGRFFYAGILKEDVALLDMEEYGSDAEVFVVETFDDFEDVYQFFRRRYGPFRVRPARDGDLLTRDFEIDISRALSEEDSDKLLYLYVEENPLVVDRNGNSQVYRNKVFIRYVFWKKDKEDYLNGG